jgi:hypothetical protein
MPPNEMMGRWASRVELNIDPHAFTLDFFRIDQRRNTAILVSRVTFSAITANALAESLDEGLRRYAATLVEASVEPLAFDTDAGDNEGDEEPGTTQ